MRDDKSVRWLNVKAGALGCLTGAGSYLLDGVGEDGSVAENVLDYVVGPGYALGGLVLAGAVAHDRWYFSRRQRLRRDLGEGGWINQQDLDLYAGARALYRRAEYLRPDLPAPGRLRRRTAPTEYGFGMGELVSGGRAVRGKRIYSPHGRGIKLVGPPGSGKSQQLINWILDFPGAQVVTSTKLELWRETSQLRGELGRTWLFNPAGLGGVPSTFGWDPVEGCKDQAVADQRAWALVRGGGGADGIDRADFWASKAAEIIRAYLMAAALVGHDMGAVHYWATHYDDRTPLGILQAHPAHVPAGWADTLEAAITAYPSTRTGYFATVVSCVGFMDNPQVAAACRPRPGDAFDTAEFLRSGTLYAVGDVKDRRLAPLLTALTEHVYGQIKDEAAKCDGGRLPLGVAMMLDEVAQQTPVPLAHWAADSRGANITIVAVLQSEAQLAMTWGDDAATVIGQALPTKVWLGGMSNREEREEAASLAGQRYVARVSEGVSYQRGGRGISSTTTQTLEPVLRPDVLYGLPENHAFVHGLGGNAGAVVRFEPGRARVARERRKLGKKAALATTEDVVVVDEPGMAGARA